MATKQGGNLRAYGKNSRLFGLLDADDHGVRADEVLHIG
jgi:hypothetical protein